jgi:hypothetical protein
MDFCPHDGYPMTDGVGVFGAPAHPPTCTNPAHPEAPECPACGDLGPHRVIALEKTMKCADCDHVWKLPTTAA